MSNPLHKRKALLLKIFCRRFCTYQRLFQTRKFPIQDVKRGRSTKGFPTFCLAQNVQSFSCVSENYVVSTVMQ